MLIHWIWFSTRPGLSDRYRAEIMQHFHDAEDVYYADRQAYACVEGLSEEAFYALEDKDLSQAEDILGQCAQKGIHILTWRDAAYPARLKAISLTSCCGSSLVMYIGIARTITPLVPNSSISNP